MVERILKLMKNENMTARELTERLGMNASTVSEWKRGKTKPSVEHVRKIAEMFDVSTDYIINGADTHAHMMAYETTAKEIDKTMLDVFCRLNATHRDAVRDFFYLCVREFDDHVRIDEQEKNTEIKEKSDVQEDFPDFDAFDAELVNQKYDEFDSKR